MASSDYVSIQDASDEALALELLQRTVHLNLDNPEEKDTPKRFVQALREMTTPQHFDFTMFNSSVDEMIVEIGIRFDTLCRHHILPFMGECHVAYIPNGKIAGLSKLPRLVAFYASNLNTQEELTVRIADSIMTHLSPLGVGVVMAAQHTCMSIRGARASGVVTRTAAMRGVFADHTKTAKAEFLEAIR